MHRHPNNHLNDLDLNISNYSLSDVLSLFNIPPNFNETHMKHARMMVMRTHPDKSDLPKEYFLFFTKAYRLLHQVYNVRTSAGAAAAVNTTINGEPVHAIRTRDAKTGAYRTMPLPAAADKAYANVIEFEGYAEPEDAGGDHASAAKANANAIKRMDHAKFNDIFNRAFEQNKVHDAEADAGYDDWFRSAAVEDGAEDAAPTTQMQMNEAIERRKRRLREQQALVVRDEYESAWSTGASQYNLTRERPPDYSSDLFSKLKYEDLRKAHTETVIPVTEEDYAAVRQYATPEELRAFRASNVQPVDPAQQHRKYEHLKHVQEMEDTRRAYILARQDEISRDVYQRFNSSFLSLQ